MKGTIYLYEVSHPDYPTVTVPSIGPDSATVEAVRRWGVPELWGRIAGYCTVRRGGRAARPRCFCSMSEICGCFGELGKRRPFLCSI